MIPWLTIPFLLWGGLSFAFGVGRWEHAAILVIVPLLAFGTARMKRLFVGLFPMGLLGLVYDEMRWFQDVGVTPERVHICDLRAIDMRLASVRVGGEPGTLHDWAQAHQSKALDLLFALPYGTYLFVSVAFAVFLYVKDYERMRLFAWAFLFVNLAGFATYHLYPAAAPWYFHAHGCTADMNAQATEGAALARVDALLGVPYFRGLYGRAADVYGAMPSLHVAYPALIVLFGWPILRWPGRTFTVVFLVTMCSAAVYLDHHWLIDVFVGFLYTLAVHAVVMAVGRARSAHLAGQSRLRPEVTQ